MQVFAIVSGGKKEVVPIATMIETPEFTSMKLLASTSGIPIVGGGRHPPPTQARSELSATFQGAFRWAGRQSCTGIGVPRDEVL